MVDPVLAGGLDWIVYRVLPAPSSLGVCETSTSCALCAHASLCTGEVLACAAPVQEELYSGAGVLSLRLEQDAKDTQ